MEIIKNLQPLLIGGTAIAGFISSIRCMFEKKSYQIPIILCCACIIIGLVLNPEIMPKIGESLIKYICKVCNIEGIV